MASQLTVKVHPTVLLTMVDAFERRSRKATNKDQALGTLLGFYEKGAIQVTDCYSIPFRVSAGGTPEIDDAFNKEMFHAARRTTPSEQIVGWFYTVSVLPNIAEQFHIYYSHVVNTMSVRRDAPPIILLTLDTNFAETGKGTLPVSAFVSNECGITSKAQTHGHVFEPLRVELDGFLGENVALDLIMKGVDSKNREVTLDNGLVQIDDSIDDLISWVDRIIAFVDNVIEKNQLPEDSNLGRKLNEIVNTAATLLTTDKRENLIKNSLRDYTMLSYLSNLTNTQLCLEERIIKN
uniref:MPN domain-containing protein n=1 Tax=Panagrellus redivivus TaxID=6233 RepID=A0A7E4W9F0_PANRE